MFLESEQFSVLVDGDLPAPAEVVQQLGRPDKCEHVTVPDLTGWNGMELPNSCVPCPV